MSKGDLILITGATGHVGFRTTILALQAGYRVRLATRSQARADAVLNAPPMKALAPSLSPDAISFIEIPDITARGAYDEAVKGVSGVIHIAASITTGGKLSTEQYKEYFITPAVQGTIGMLESAAKTPSVKRVVITSSMAAIMGGPGTNATTIYNDESRTPNDEGPYASELQAYAASKKASLNATEVWLSEHKPQFDVVNLGPSFIMGRDDLDTSASGSIHGTNSVILRVALGDDAAQPVPGASVHNEDVARSHVQALDESIPAGFYLLSYNPDDAIRGTQWEDIAPVVQKLFPKAIEKGSLPQPGKGATAELRIDGRKAEKVFGFKYLNLEEQVKSVVGHYLELKEAGKD